MILNKKIVVIDYLFSFVINEKNMYNYYGDGDEKRNQIKENP